mgnify:CR=1 FL=1
MAHIVIMGAGVGGVPMAYEMQEKIRKGDKVTVVSNSENFHFVPSNPWVGVKWRDREDIEFPIRPYLEQRHRLYLHRRKAGAPRTEPSRIE